ncbi:protein FRA10AC1 homolog [Ceratitis capitata]|uniref:protein FRA10AC1 homolog n=1 Tax=Ceratitis capitata TaxID=7213 RepID=UPI0003299995|nr:protein FRA10AC1 homolog [Ceratitis capitata]
MESIDSLSRQQRHNFILKNFILSSKSNQHNHDIDVIREHHRFLWDENGISDDCSWEERLARRYYCKLFKEYCIADLTRYKENKVALRWRTKDEVVSGKGQFKCGSRKCEQQENLRTWEVNFAYREQGQHKNALVKIRLCPKHSEELNYTSRKREIKRLKKSKVPHGGSKTSSKEIQKNSTEIKEEIADSSSYLQNNTQGKELKDVTHGNEDKIWSRKPDIGLEQSSRESDFERYLEDLLL